jgi:hypothetical protein
VATVTITLTDSEDGSMTISADYGERVEQGSQAHQCANVLVQNILESAKSFERIEDTAPEVNVEPNRIITTEGANENGI